MKCSIFQNRHQAQVQKWAKIDREKLWPFLFHNQGHSWMDIGKVQHCMSKSCENVKEGTETKNWRTITFQKCCNFRTSCFLNYTHAAYQQNQVHKQLPKAEKLAKTTVNLSFKALSASLRQAQSKCIKRKLTFGIKRSSSERVTTASWPDPVLQDPKNTSWILLHFVPWQELQICIKNETQHSQIDKTFVYDNERHTFAINCKN